MTATKKIFLLLLFVFPGVLTGCTSPPTRQIQKEILFKYPVSTSANRFLRPAFLLKDPEKQYNIIGRPSIREGADQKTEIYVDPNNPAIFFETQEFTTPKGAYKNLIYRIHFEQVPLALDKLNITAGKNTGILIIYTVDDKGQLLLVTTVHTCGCFLAFFPTKSLPGESYPSGWPATSQWVYGYILPSLLQPAPANDSERIVFTLESETHRISDVAIRDRADLQKAYTAIDLEIFPMNSLYQLPFKGRTESFFAMEGARQGYVRDNTKILERIFISWWAFDLHVGEDKAFGLADSSTTILYTSLKFWDRTASDLKNFPRFLSYWGWKL